jgi:peptide/nickel transport system permease protein
MIRFIVSRLSSSLLVLLVLSALVFFGGSTLAPGDVAASIAGADATQEQIATVARSLGLDQSLYVQYFDWLRGFATGDLGISPITQRTVSEVLVQQTPLSIELALIALLLSTAIGLPVGLFTAVRAQKAADIVTRVPFLAIFSIPVFVIGTLLVLFAASYTPGLYSAEYIPLSEGLLGNLRSLLLPSLTATVPTTALVIQMTRSTMLESLSQPYVAMARMKGVAERRIHNRHALKNALPPIVTMQGFQFGLLLGNLFVIEEIFSLPGLGRGILESIDGRDFITLQGQVIVIAAAFILANLIVDMVVPLLDRRIVTAGAVK